MSLDSMDINSVAVYAFVLAGGKALKTHPACCHSSPYIYFSKLIMIIQRVGAGIFVCLIINGCATASKEIQATYTSTVPYQSYDCQQLAIEGERFNSRLLQLGGKLDQSASNDNAIAGIGILVFWPALFVLGGTKQQEADYGRLKGEYEALIQVANEKKCAGFVS